MISSAVGMEFSPLQEMPNDAPNQLFNGRLEGARASRPASPLRPSITPPSSPPSPPTPADIDFGALPRNLRSTDPAARGRFDLEHKEALASLRAALARLAPNLRAAAQFEAVRAREREHLEELEAARRAERAAAAAFAAVRAARHDAFTAAFEHVAACIDPIYKARRALWDGQRSVLVLVGVDFDGGRGQPWRPADHRLRTPRAPSPGQRAQCHRTPPRPSLPWHRS